MPPQPTPSTDIDLNLNCPVCGTAIREMAMTDPMPGEVDRLKAGTSGALIICPSAGCTEILTFRDNGKLGPLLASEILDILAVCPAVVHQMIRIRHQIRLLRHANG
jgi:hypothetical protein